MIRAFVDALINALALAGIVALILLFGAGGFEFLFHLIHSFVG